MSKRANKRKKAPVLSIVGPTDEQMFRAPFQRTGLSYRRVPVIDTLLAAGKLTHAQHIALSYYRDQASRAEDDIGEQGTLAPEKIMGGGGGSCMGGFIPAALIATSAILETSRIERDLGSLLGIARAICVDDMTIQQWCISQHGGRERLDGKGKFVAMVPVAEKRSTEMALLELKFASGRIVR